MRDTKTPILKPDRLSIEYIVIYSQVIIKNTRYDVSTIRLFKLRYISRGLL